MSPPHLASSGTGPTAVEAELAKIFQHLGKHLPEDYQFSDADIRRVGSLLTRLPNAQPSWNRAPRTYVILRFIDQAALFDRFLQTGFNDYLLPVQANGLPECLDSAVRVAFMKAQHVVCTRAVELENGGHQVFGASQSKELFSVSKVLGTSTLSQVDHVTSNSSFKEYARKRVVRRTSASRGFNETASIFVSELEILKRLEHEHIVAIKGSYTDPKYFVLLLSPVAECNLAEYFGKVLETPELKPTLRTFFGCLASVAAYLHDNLVKHKDIKPQNVLVHQGTVLLTDFGISRLAEDSSGVTTEGWTLKTPLYCAPEVASYGKRGTSSDIWSLGCVFLEMATILKGRSIQDMSNFFRRNGSHEVSYGANEDAIMGWVKHLGRESPLADSVPLRWITPMLQHSRESRPSAREVAQLAYAEHVDSPHLYCGLCCSHASDGELFGQPARSENIAERAFGTSNMDLGRLEPSIEAKTVAGLGGAKSPNPNANPPHARASKQSVAMPTEPPPGDEPEVYGSKESAQSYERYAPHEDAVIDYKPTSGVLVAAKAAFMDICDSAFCIGGRELAHSMTSYVHEGGGFRADALLRATERDDISAMDFLIGRGFKVNERLYTASPPVTPIEVAMRKYRSAGTSTGLDPVCSPCVALPFLLDCLARIDYFDAELVFACLEKACCEDFELVRKFFYAGLRLDAFGPDLDSYHLLIAACTPLDVKLGNVEFLLDKGVNRQFEWNVTAKSALQKIIDHLHPHIQDQSLHPAQQRRLTAILLKLIENSVSASWEERKRIIEIAIWFDLQDIPPMFPVHLSGLTEDERHYGLQYWHMDFSPGSPGSWRFWHNTFFKEIKYPWKRSMLPDLTTGNFENHKFRHPFPISPIELCLIELASAARTAEFNDWKTIVTFNGLRPTTLRLPLAYWRGLSESFQWPAFFIAASFASNGSFDSTSKQAFAAVWTYMLPVKRRASTVTNPPWTPNLPPWAPTVDWHTVLSNSVFITAVMFGFVPAIEILLDDGMDVNQLIMDESNKFKAPLDLALAPPTFSVDDLKEYKPKIDEEGRDKIVRLLKEKGAQCLPRDVAEKLHVVHEPEKVAKRSPSMWFNLI